VREVLRRAEVVELPTEPEVERAILGQREEKEAPAASQPPEGSPRKSGDLLGTPEVAATEERPA
jgi:hypothetical protein